MNEEELEGLRQKKAQQRLQAMQMEEQSRQLFQKLLTPEAYERMCNVKVSNSELYMSVAATLAYLYKAGQIKEKISDEKLLMLLGKVTDRKETKIEFKRK
jgi:programmed cell death protein 5